MLCIWCHNCSGPPNIVTESLNMIIIEMTGCSKDVGSPKHSSRNRELWFPKEDTRFQMCLRTSGSQSTVSWIAVTARKLQGYQGTSLQIIVHEIVSYDFCKEMQGFIRVWVLQNIVHDSWTMIPAREWHCLITCSCIRSIVHEIADYDFCKEMQGL